MLFSRIGVTSDTSTKQPIKIVIFHCRNASLYSCASHQSVEIFHDFIVLESVDCYTVLVTFLVSQFKCLFVDAINLLKQKSS